MKLYISKKIQQIDEVLDQWLPKKNQYPNILWEAVRYSVFSGGKRLRPILLLATFEGLEKNKSKEVLNFAAALEMIHTYSLIHDDLPALDNDDFRRGRLTCHKKFGEAIAILAGDALLNLAFEIMTKTCCQSKDPMGCLQAMDQIGSCAGAFGMIAGQVADITEKDQNKEKLDYIQKNKTGKLIAASLSVGSILAGAKQDFNQKIYRIGLKLGEAFQIQDDILDQIGNEEIIGKPLNSDGKNNKLTNVSYYGLDRSIAFQNGLYQTIQEEIKSFEGNFENLLYLVKYMENRNK